MHFALNQLFRLNLISPQHRTYKMTTHAVTHVRIVWYIPLYNLWFQLKIAAQILCSFQSLNSMALSKIISLATHLSHTDRVQIVFSPFFAERR